MMMNQESISQQIYKLVNFYILRIAQMMFEIIMNG